MRGTDRLEGLVDTAPLPLAQGVARVLNAKTDIELHSKALDLVELSVALAGAVRLAFALEAFTTLPAKLVKTLDAQLAGLSDGSGYSLGKFSALLSAVATALDDSEWAASLGSSALCKTHGSWLGMTEYGEELLRDSSLPRDAVLSTRKRGILGFFELCTAYRNREKGHGATRYDAYYARMGPALCGAVADVISSEALLGPGELVAIERFGSGLRQRRLRGCMGRALRNPIDTRMWEGSVAWKLDERLLPLSPFVTHWLTNEGGDRIGIISRLEAGGKRARYLDYPSGDQTSLAAGATQCRVLHRRIHAEGALDPAELAEAELEVDDAPTGDGSLDPAASGEAVFDLGDYELVDELGRGGMGVVYLARDRRMDRQVALKVSAAPGLLDELNTRRLRRETVALARADHPNVIKVFSSGRAGAEYYFAMEHIDGVDLAKLATHLRELRETTPGRALSWSHVVESLHTTQAPRPNQEPTPDQVETEPAAEHTTKDTTEAAAEHTTEDTTEPATESAAEARPARRGARPDQRDQHEHDDGPARSFYHELASRFAGVARGVDHLHAHGVIHRDIKPANLMMTANGERFVVTDLGLAKLDDASVELTKTGAGPVGTLRYSAPEQLQPDLLDVDERTDVYGLGATLYELATGHSCHDETEDKQLIRQILLGAPKPPHEVDPDIPRELAIVIEKAIAKEPERRYQSAAELAEDLERVAADLPPRARPIGLPRRVVLWSRRHPNATLVSGVSAVVLVLGALIGSQLSKLWPDDAHVEDVRYYASLVERRGVGEGHRELHPWELSTAWCYYAVFTVDGRVVATERRHGTDTPFPDAADITRWDYEYTDQGRLHKATSKTVNGQVVQIDNYDCWDDHHCRVRMLDEQSNLLKAPQLSSADSLDVLDAVDVFAAEKDYDDLGRLVKVAYLGPGALDPRPHPGGYWGTRYDYEGDAALPSREIHLGPDGQPMPSILGVASIELDHDDYGLPTRKAYYDVNHAPVAGPGACAIETFSYAAPGAMSSSNCFDQDGAPALTNDGWSRAVAEYDRHGNQIRLLYFGTDGAPVLLRTTHAHHIETSYDDAGHSLSDAFFGIAGEPVRPSDRAHRIEYARDALGNLTKISLFDGDGQPDVSSTGLHEWRYTRDTRGNITRFDYFDANGQPTTAAEGHAAQVVDYDERGRNKTRVAHFDLDGQPTIIADGYHAELSAYDSRGNVVAWSYVGTTGQPTIDSRRIHRIEATRDDFGRASSHSYFGGDDQPILTPDGYHRITYEYNPIGQLVALAHYGIDGQPVPARGSAFRVRQRYDQLGRVTSVSFEGVHDEPAVNGAGVHEIRIEYDARGRSSGKRYFGPDGQPVLNTDGVHRYVIERDAFGQITATVNFGISEARVIDHGCWREEYDHDERGERVALRCYGVDGQPTMHTSGYHQERTRYDDRGRPVEVAYFDVDDQPVLVSGYARSVTVYDARGGVTQRAYFGIDGQPIAALGGAHRTVYTLDHLGRITRLERFAVDGQRAPDEGCAIKALAWNDQGQRIELSCLDGDGKRMISDKGWSRVRTVYDARGDYTEKFFYGLDDQPINDAQDHYHHRVDSFDLAGHIIEHREYDADGQLLLDRHHAYDALGHLVRTSFFADNEAPTFDPNGCHAVAHERDTYGRLTSETCLDLDGSPTEDVRGIASSRWVYDVFGEELERSYFGPGGEPIAPPGVGFHLRQRAFDERGHLDVTRYFDAKLRPISHAGSHEQRLEHDALGRRVSEAHFGPDGAPVAVDGDGTRFHRRVTTHDDDTDIQATRDYDTAGRPLTSVFLTETQFDESGRPIRTRYFGPDEQPTVITRGDVQCHEIVTEYSREGGRPITIYRDLDGNELYRE